MFIFRFSARRVVVVPIAAREGGFWSSGFGASAGVAPGGEAFEDGDVVEVLAALGGRPVAVLCSSGLHPDQVLAVGDQQVEIAELDRRGAGAQVLVVCGRAGGWVDGEHVEVAVPGGIRQLPP